VQIEPFCELLSSYAPDDPRERDFVLRMQALARMSAPFSRDHFLPGHFTASAFVIDPASRALLLILHKKLGLWLQPGGHVEVTDEHVESAARREVLEETGVLELRPLLSPGSIFDVDIHAIPARKNEPAHEHFDVRFAFAATDPSLLETGEVEAVRWVPFERVASVTADESVLRAVRKLDALGVR
jgi:8-oxo-dGTP pyrophosphatase MutT (NUDIX family)